ncbi:MAG TPA: class I SAM-dependent methyltransferase [Chryseosolibacter sp.]
MELSVAKKLIGRGVNSLGSHQVWADLGAGEGLFTSALVELLPAGSIIIAIDKDEHALKRLSAGNVRSQVRAITADLNKLPENLPQLDGIVMANSLHYIRDQVKFLEQLKIKFLSHSGVLVVVEYDLEKPNAWVPYPIGKRKLVALANDAGFTLEIFPESVHSRLNSSEIYSAALKPK